MANNHSWSGLHDEYALLECHSTGVDFWDVVRKNYVYCPACGEKV